MRQSDPTMQWVDWAVQRESITMMQVAGRCWICKVPNLIYGVVGLAEFGKSDRVSQARKLHENFEVRSLWL